MRAAGGGFGLLAVMTRTPVRVVRAVDFPPRRPNDPVTEPFRRGSPDS
ncbi:hypothetical protein K701_05465 [Streptomyces fradiae ATCC 10745 = DSM 40063]|uniref:Uncharacterized protein n=1 Tax=Streptomyces fradiae ATCC 10745 = DSM 40063 TaxID=1319510 RepID=A0ABQ6XYL9_STRFR|nr:hypothetical protein K701_05465 [Streptomyces fradiae ATCC 10745 = DSM 40063]